MNATDRHRLLRMVVAGATGVSLFLILDISVGAWRHARRDEASRRVQRSAEPFHRANAQYHHDLKPRYDGKAIWGPFEYHMVTNSLGFRDSSAREVPLHGTSPRVLIMGDSFTEGIGID